MPLNHANTRTFHRRLYSGELITCILLKRGNDQAQGTVVSHALFETRRSSQVKRGEPIQDDMAAQHTTSWHIPVTELHRVGVQYLNALDRIVEDHGQGNAVLSPQDWHYWQPESGDTIHVKLFSNWVTFDALRVDPPDLSEQPN